ncbi:MAG: FAD-dependent thymidylate synthase, partial [Leptospira sp.]|nr:FAD-dependent thymidylate synthase [Leptospira sp.]
LPLSTYTEAYWKIDWHNLLHFLALRMDGHAQLEIRNYAKTIGYEIVSKWVPNAWEAFLDYRFHASGLTRIEKDIITAFNKSGKDAAIKKAIEYGLLNEDISQPKKSRERDELEMKFEEMGFTIPWA